jgi:uncharacterized protein
LIVQGQCHGQVPRYRTPPPSVDSEHYIFVMRLDHMSISDHLVPRETPMSLPCPSCKIDLVMSDRQGIEIDYCPKCRGVWLDRGELDKIIERNTENTRVSSQEKPGGYDVTSMARRILKDDDDYKYRSGYDDDYRYKKKRNWLKEIFD